MLVMKFFINNRININRENEQWVLLPLKKLSPTSLRPHQISVFLTHSGDKRYPFLRLTNLLPSDGKK